MGCGASRASSGRQDAGTVDSGGRQSRPVQQPAAPQGGGGDGGGAAPAAAPAALEPDAPPAAQPRPVTLITGTADVAEAPLSALGSGDTPQPAPAAPGEATLRASPSEPNAPPNAPPPPETPLQEPLPAPAPEPAPAAAKPPADGAPAPEPLKDSGGGGGGGDGSPVRLLLVEGFAAFTQAVPCYEHLPPGSYVDVPFEDYLAAHAADTAVISWRWARPKPPDLAAAAAAASCPVPLPLVEYVTDRARHDGIRYLWLDWACAPQYPQDLGATMREINRSGQYYATSRGFYVWCFAARVTAQDFQHLDYFGRAWTLSERLHRARARAPLTAGDFLPAPLDGLFGAPLPAPLPPAEWMPHVAEICSQISRADHVDAPLLRSVGGIVLRRYPLLAKVAAAAEGPLRSVLRPDVAAALRGCARLRALVDWALNPCAASDGLLSDCVSQPLQLKAAALQAAVEDLRKALNNYSPSLGGAEGLTSAYAAFGLLRSGDSEGAALLLPPAEALWREALAAPTAESAASPDWLRVYLVFGAGSAYKAFAAQDLLFAIYKLFLADDYSYGQEASLYGELVRVARCRWLGRPEAGPYDWLRELADLTPDEAGVVSSLLEAVPNGRTDAADALSPANFGIFTLGRQRPSPQAAHPQLAVPDLFGGVQYDDGDVLTHVLGFHLDPAAQRALGQRLGGFSRVPKAAGGEIDDHLSLRGRESLGRFEEKLHAALAQACAQPWQEDCGLFVVVRYGTGLCLSKCVVVRASRQEGEGGAGGSEWVVEELAAFGSEAQKGSSWGVARALQLLVADVCALPGDKEAAYKFYTAASAKGFFEVEELRSENFASEGQAAWFSSFTVAFAANRAAPTPATQEQQQRALASRGGGAGIGDGEEGGTCERSAASSASDKAVDAMLGELGFMAQPKGISSFDDAEIQRVEEAYTVMLQGSFSEDGLNEYYQAVSRNYVHDSVMAEHLGFYAKLCGVYTRHLEESGSTLLQAQLLRQQFSYMREDLGDAIMMAEDDAQKEAAMEALAALTQALEAAGGSGSDSD